jgi:hypothetical protein
LTDGRKLIPAADEVAIKDTDELIRRATVSLEKERKKQKATWSKAFKKNEQEAESESPMLTSIPQNSTTPIKPAPAKEPKEVPSAKKATPSSGKSKGSGIDLSSLLKKDESAHDGENEPESEDEKLISSSASMIANVVLVLSAVAIIGLVAFRAKGFKK